MTVNEMLRNRQDIQVHVYCMYEQQTDTQLTHNVSTTLNLSRGKVVLYTTFTQHC